MKRRAIDGMKRKTHLVVFHTQKMAEANGHQMELVPEPEMEVQDIHYWLGQLEGYIQDNQRMNEKINNAFEEIRRKVAEQDILNESIEAQAENVEEIDPEKLSSTAFSLSEETPGALTADKFREFLMLRSYRKPFPPVLPILRGYSSDVEGVKEQLLAFRIRLKRAHQEYKIERRKDENLERRIERLVNNIDNELRVENRDGLQQASINSYVHRRH